MEAVAIEGEGRARRRKMRSAGEEDEDEDGEEDEDEEGEEDMQIEIEMQDEEWAEDGVAQGVMGVEGRGPTRRRQRMTTTTTSGSRQPRRARGRGGTSRGVEGVQQSDSRATAVDMRKSRRLLWRRCRCWLLLQGAAAGGCCGAGVC